MESEEDEQSMILLQGNIVNKLIKRIFPDKLVTSQFKKQFIKALSLFILYIQSCQAKKKYGKNEILSILQQEGFGKVAQKLRNSSKSIINQQQQQNNRKKIPQIEIEIEQ